MVEVRWVVRVLSHFDGVFISRVWSMPRRVEDVTGGSFPRHKLVSPCTALPLGGLCPSVIKRFPAREETVSRWLSDGESEAHASVRSML